MAIRPPSIGSTGDGAQASVLHRPHRVSRDLETSVREGCIHSNADCCQDRTSDVAGQTSEQPLRAACAHWLRSQGLSDHEVAPVLGLAQVRSVDRLLRHHAALDAQRRVKERRDQWHAG
jgi:hypothetical protein